MIGSDRYTFLKYGSYALLMLGLFVLQSARGTALFLAGMSVNALPFFVAAVALLEGPYAGGTYGFICGVLLSLNSLNVEGFASLWLGLFGVIFGMLGAHYLRPVILSALAGGVLCMMPEAFFRYVFRELLRYGMGPGEALVQLGASLLLSLPAGALTWLAAKAICRRFSEDRL